MHLPPKFSLDVLCRGIEIGVIQVVADHDEVDIALSGVESLRYRSVYEGALDRTGVWLERPLDRLGQADGLFDQTAQFLENRGRRVRSVVLLLADAFDRHETAPCQLRQFALDRAHPGADASHDLRRVEAAFGVVEDEREDALLNLGEQCVGQAHGVRLRTHVPKYSTQIGYVQSCDLKVTAP